MTGMQMRLVRAEGVGVGVGGCWSKRREGGGGGGVHIQGDWASSSMQVVAGWCSSAGPAASLAPGCPALNSALCAAPGRSDKFRSHHTLR